MKPSSLVVASLGVLSACNSVDVDDIREHRTQWREQAIEDYVFVYRRACFCGAEEIFGARVVVRDGAVESSTGSRSGLPLGSTPLTLEDVFSKAISFAEDDPDEFDIAYDDMHHFVQMFSADPEKNAADEELMIEVSCFSTDLEGGCPVPTYTESACTSAGGESRAIENEDAWGSCSPLAFPLGRIEGANRLCCTDDRRSL